MRKKLVFFDRDGVVNLESHPYTFKIEDFHFAPGFFEFFAKLRAQNALCFLITNQSGINRGYFTQKDLEKLHHFMQETIKQHCKGGFDKIYFCPHTPTEDCNCRKPKPAMILEALREFGLALEDFSSYFIGDSLADMQAAKSAEVSVRILIDSARNLECREATHVVKDLQEASAIVLRP